MSLGEFKPQAGLIRLWHQEDATDSSGGGYNLTDTNITHNAGKFNKAADFNGTNSRQNGADTGMPTGTGQRTWSFWVKMDALPPGGQEDTFMAYATDSANYKYYGVTILGTGPQLRTAYWGYDQDNTFAFTTGVWYNIVVVHDASSNGVQYVNGKQIGSTSRSSANTTLKELFIGYLKPFSSGWLDGKIDEVAFFNVAKTAGWVRRQYSIGRFGDL